MEYDDKYWKDYTNFIQDVEKLTERSPSDLIGRYSELIEELEDINEDFYLEWKYEFSYDVFVRELIEKVLKLDSVKDNILLDNFQSQIGELDSRIKSYISNYNEDFWWKKPVINKFISN